MEPQVIKTVSNTEDLYFNNTSGDGMWVTSTLTVVPNTIIKVNKSPDFSAIMPGPPPLTPQQMQELIEGLFERIKADKAEKLGSKVLETKHEEKRVNKPRRLLRPVQ